MKTISYEEFVDTYKPEFNPEDDATLMDADPRLQSTSVEVFNKAVGDNRVWTLVDSEPYPVITNGFHFVNRLEHYICEVPFEADEIIEVED